MLSSALALLRQREICQIQLEQEKEQENERGQEYGFQPVCA